MLIARGIGNLAQIARAEAISFDKTLEGSFATFDEVWQSVSKTEGYNAGRRAVYEVHPAKEDNHNESVAAEVEKSLRADEQNAVDLEERLFSAGAPSSSSRQIVEPHASTARSAVSKQVAAACLSRLYERFEEHEDKRREREEKVRSGLLNFERFPSLGGMMGPGLFGLNPASVEPLRINTSVDWGGVAAEISDDERRAELARRSRASSSSRPNSRGTSRSRAVSNASTPRSRGSTAEAGQRPTLGLGAAGPPANIWSRAHQRLLGDPDAVSDGTVNSARSSHHMREFGVDTDESDDSTERRRARASQEGFSQTFLDNLSIAAPSAAEEQRGRASGQVEDQEMNIISPTASPSEGEQQEADNVLRSATSSPDEAVDAEPASEDESLYNQRRRRSHGSSPGSASSPGSPGTASDSSGEPPRNRRRGRQVVNAAADDGEESESNSVPSEGAAAPSRPSLRGLAAARGPGSSTRPGPSFRPSVFLAAPPLGDMFGPQDVDQELPQGLLSTGIEPAELPRPMGQGPGALGEGMESESETEILQVMPDGTHQPLGEEDAQERRAYTARSPSPPNSKEPRKRRPVSGRTGGRNIPENYKGEGTNKDDKKEKATSARSSVTGLINMSDSEDASDRSLVTPRSGDGEEQARGSASPSATSNIRRGNRGSPSSKTRSRSTSRSKARKTTPRPMSRGPPTKKPSTSGVGAQRLVALLPERKQPVRRRSSVQRRSSAAADDEGRSLGSYSTAVTAPWGLMEPSDDDTEITEIVEEFRPAQRVEKKEVLEAPRDTWAAPVVVPSEEGRILSSEMAAAVSSSSALLEQADHAFQPSNADVFEAWGDDNDNVAQLREGGDDEDMLFLGGEGSSLPGARALPVWGASAEGPVQRRRGMKKIPCASRRGGRLGAAGETAMTKSLHHVEAANEPAPFKPEHIVPALEDFVTHYLDMPFDGSGATTDVDSVVVLPSTTSPAGRGTHGHASPPVVTSAFPAGFLPTSTAVSREVLAPLTSTASSTAAAPQVDVLTITRPTTKSRRTTRGAPELRRRRSKSLPSRGRQGHLQVSASSSHDSQAPELPPAWPTTSESELVQTGAEEPVVNYKGSTTQHQQEGIIKQPTLTLNRQSEDLRMSQLQELIFFGGSHQVEGAKMQPTRPLPAGFLPMQASKRTTFGLEELKYLGIIGGTKSLEILTRYLKHAFLEEVGDVYQLLKNEDFQLAVTTMVQNSSEHNINTQTAPPTMNINSNKISKQKLLTAIDSVCKIFLQDSMIEKLQIIQADKDFFLAQTTKALDPTTNADYSQQTKQKQRAAREKREAHVRKFMKVFAVEIVQFLNRHPSLFSRGIVLFRLLFRKIEETIFSSYVPPQLRKTAEDAERELVEEQQRNADGPLSEEQQNLRRLQLAGGTRSAGSPTRGGAGGPLATTRQAGRALFTESGADVASSASEGSRSGSYSSSSSAHQVIDALFDQAVAWEQGSTTSAAELREMETQFANLEKRQKEILHDPVFDRMLEKEKERLHERAEALRRQLFNGREVVAKVISSDSINPPGTTMKNRKLQETRIKPVVAWTANERQQVQSLLDQFDSNQKSLMDIPEQALAITAEVEVYKDHRNKVLTSLLSYKKLVADLIFKKALCGPDSPQFLFSTSTTSSSPLLNRDNFSSSCSKNDKPLINPKQYLFAMEIFDAAPALQYGLKKRFFQAVKKSLVQDTAAQSDAIRSSAAIKNLVKEAEAQKEIMKVHHMILNWSRFKTSVVVSATASAPAILMPTTRTTAFTPDFWGAEREVIKVNAQKRQVAFQDFFHDSSKNPIWRMMDNAKKQAASAYKKLYDDFLRRRNMGASIRLFHDRQSLLDGKLLENYLEQLKKSARIIAAAITAVGFYGGPNALLVLDSIYDHEKEATRWETFFRENKVSELEDFKNSNPHAPLRSLHTGEFLSGSGERREMQRKLLFELQKPFSAHRMHFSSREKRTQIDNAINENAFRDAVLFGGGLLNRDSNASAKENELDVALREFYDKKIRPHYDLIDEAAAFATAHILSGLSYFEYWFKEKRVPDLSGRLDDGLEFYDGTTNELLATFHKYNLQHMPHRFRQHLLIKAMQRYSLPGSSEDLLVLLLGMEPEARGAARQLAVHAGRRHYQLDETEIMELP